MGRQVGGPAELGIRDAQVATSFLSAVCDPAFWPGSQGLRQLSEPVRKPSGWVKGRNCHEASLQGKGRKDVKCVWEGCRAPSVEARLQAFEDAILEMRRSSAEDIPGMGIQDASSALTMFHWFHPSHIPVGKGFSLHSVAVGQLRHCGRFCAHP